MQYDRTDARILEIVQKNTRLTSEVIGEMAGLSATACQRRLKRLRTDGIIEADVSIVSAKAVGRPIQMLVLVSLERERADIIDRFKKDTKSSSEVVNGFYVTGDADFILYITARTMEGQPPIEPSNLDPGRWRCLGDDRDGILGRPGRAGTNSNDAAVLSTTSCRTSSSIDSAMGLTDGQSRAT